MPDTIITEPETPEASSEAKPANPPPTADAIAVLMATRGVEAALNQVGPRLTPPLRAAVRAVLMAHAAPAAIAAHPREGMQMRPTQNQPHPIDTKKTETNMKPRNQRNQQNKRSKNGAKKRTRIIRAHLSPRWQAVYDALPDQPARAALMPLITLCHALGVEPHEVDQSIVDKLVDALRLRGHPDPRSRANAAIKRWTTLIFLGLALPPLQPIANEQSRYRAAWRALPRPLRVAIIQYLRAFAMKKLGTRIAYRVKLRAAIALLTAAGRTPQTLDDLIAVETIDFLAAHESFGDLDAVSHNRKHMLRTLADLARHHRRRAEKSYILPMTAFAAAESCIEYVADVGTVYRNTPQSITRSGFEKTIAFLDGVSRIFLDIEELYGKRDDFDRLAWAWVPTMQARAAFRLNNTEAFNSAIKRLQTIDPKTARTLPIVLRRALMKSPMLVRSANWLLDAR